MLKIILFLTFLFCACNSSTKSSLTNSKTLDFSNFTIETPINWQIIHSRGVDSYVGGIQIDSIYSASFDLGLYSSDLSDFVKENLKDTMYDRIKAESFPPLNDDTSWIHKIKKCRVEWDTIDGRLAKIIIPINSGFGMTGIYFDSLWQSNGTDKIRFQLNANNLDPKNERLLLRAFKTLKFKAPN